MSLVSFNFESQYLGNNQTVGIILPDKPRTVSPAEFYGSGKKYKVLWLLHGMFGDYTDWIRKSMIELYASERNLIVVMPSGLNSNYSNWPAFATGFNMYDYLLDELMPVVYNWFPASDKREDNFIAGLSMGGWGTCLYAFNHPEKFAGACALSGFPRDLHDHDPKSNPMWGNIKRSVINYCGEDELMDSYQNTMAALRKNLENGVEMPRLLFGCGEDDGMIYPSFCAFKEEAKAMNLDAEFFSIPGYKHEWRFWDIGIQKALDFFGLTHDKPANPF